MATLRGGIFDPNQVTPMNADALAPMSEFPISTIFLLVILISFSITMFVYTLHSVKLKIIHKQQFLKTNNAFRNNAINLKLAAKTQGASHAVYEDNMFHSDNIPSKLFNQRQQRPSNNTNAISSNNSASADDSMTIVNIELATPRFRSDSSSDKVTGRTSRVTNLLDNYAKESDSVSSKSAPVRRKDKVDGILTNYSQIDHKSRAPLSAPAESANNIFSDYNQAERSNSTSIDKSKNSDSSKPVNRVNTILSKYNLAERSNHMRAEKSKIIEHSKDVDRVNTILSNYSGDSKQAQQSRSRSASDSARYMQSQVDADKSSNIAQNGQQKTRLSEITGSQASPSNRSRAPSDPRRAKTTAASSRNPNQS